ncbi:tyrosine-type recombinase/integrase [Enterococcus faecalis]
MNNSIKKYTKKNGTTAYMFKKYLGTDPLTGKQKETTRRGFKTMKEAKLALSRLELDIQENGIQPTLKNSKYEVICNEWFDNVYKYRVKESSFWNTKLIFKKHILPKLGSLYIQKITTAHCQKFANEWSKKSPKRYKRFINYAGMIFKYAISIDILQKNPMEKINIPIVHINEEDVRKFYEKNELIDFLTRMKVQFPIMRYTLFSLLAYTGMRKGEALSLQWADINFEDRILFINKSLATGKDGQIILHPPKNKTSRRTISLDPLTVELLRQWKNIQSKELKAVKLWNGHNQLLFPNYDNHFMHPRTPQTWLETFYRKNPDILKISPHGFRHTHASLLFASGATMKQTQLRLGHSTIKTTMNVYTHVTKEVESETAELFSSFMQS